MFVDVGWNKGFLNLKVWGKLGYHKVKQVALLQDLSDPLMDQYAL